MSQRIFFFIAVFSVTHFVTLFLLSGVSFLLSFSVNIIFNVVAVFLGVFLSAYKFSKIKQRQPTKSENFKIAIGCLIASMIICYFLAGLTAFAIPIDMADYEARIATALYFST